MDDLTPAVSVPVNGGYFSCSGDLQDIYESWYSADDYYFDQDAINPEFNDIDQEFGRLVAVGRIAMLPVNCDPRLSSFLPR